MQRTLPFPAPPPDRPDQEPCVVGELAVGLTRTLSLTRALIESGRQVDLAGLDSKIGALCARALDLPPEEGRAARPHLQSLLDELDRISSRLAGPPERPDRTG